MKHFLKKFAAVAVAVPLALSVSFANAEKIKIALAETPSDELAACRDYGNDGERILFFESIVFLDIRRFH